jgi:parallel beta-helix repeat protein
MMQQKRHVHFRQADVLCFVSALILCVSIPADAWASEADRGTSVANRPIRSSPRLTLAVGQTEGDLQGRDDKVIQAGIDYLNRLGGGTLRILPGVYLLQNALYLRPHITLRGSGKDTILKKAPSVVTSLLQDSDWFEYGVRVKDTRGFEPGRGIMLRSSTGPGAWQYDVLQATIMSVQGNTVFVDRVLRKNFWVDKNVTAATIFPLITADHADDVRVEDLVLDGNREENEHINGNYAGAMFIQECNRWSFKNVCARNYNGDGFSFQVCDDIQFHDCQALNNTDLGFHPGSGSQCPVFRNCVAKGNSLGLFFCWGVSDGRAEDCVLSENRRYGISIGHRDTDNIIRNCSIERNGQVGILFRKEASSFLGGHRNRIENCLIRDNGSEQGGIGIDIQGSTRDISILQNCLENKNSQNQKVAIRISTQAENINLKDNSFIGCPIEIEDQRQ